MISHRRAFWPFMAATVVAFGWLPARSQEVQPGAGDIVARVFGDFFRRPYLAIAAVDPTGQVRFEVDPGPLRTRDFFVPGDGCSLMVIRPAAAPDDVRLYRVEIREITAVDAPARSFTAAMTPAVAAQLHAGDHAFLVHPPCTTRQLRDLPDAIPLEADEPPAPDEAREIASRARSINNLKTIGLALHNFHSAHDQFPPAVISGPDGKPWHSWRVLLLPYMEQANLYNQYRFDEPWDGPNNRKLLDQMPEVFRDPIHGDGPDHFTHYAALVGEETAFPPSGAILRDANRPVRLPIGPGSGGATGVRNMTDGTSNTLLVAPVSPDRKIPWTKPEDIAVGPDFPGLGRPGGIAAPYRARSGPDGHHAAPVLFGDGSARVLIDSIDPKTLTALTTRAGDEWINADAIPSDPQATQFPTFMTVRIRRDGSRVRATIEPVEIGREGAVEPAEVRRKETPVRTRPAAPTP